MTSLHYQSVSLARFRRELGSFVSSHAHLQSPVVITNNDQETAVVMSIEKWRQIQETMLILSSPELMRQIEAAEDDIGAGRVTPAEHVFAEIRREQGSDS